MGCHPPLRVIPAKPGLGWRHDLSRRLRARSAQKTLTARRFGSTRVTSSATRSTTTSRASIASTTRAAIPFRGVPAPLVAHQFVYHPGRDAGADALLLIMDGAIIHEALRPPTTSLIAARLAG
jgi:hypothetical protein